MVKIAINGFGEIGKALFWKSPFEIVAINKISPHLMEFLKQKRFSKGRNMLCFNYAEPSDIPWPCVDCIIESAWLNAKISVSTSRNNHKRNKSKG